MKYSLAGRRILITRSRSQASELAGYFEAMGATTVLIPTIEMIPPLSFAPLDEAIATLDRFDWLVFTSANAVEPFRERSAGHDRHALARIQTAAIGPATAREATRMGLNVALVPPVAVAESLTSALLAAISPGARTLLVRAAAARNYLPETLMAKGIEVTIVEAYQTRIPATSIAEIGAIFSDGASFPEAITFTSSSTVTNLMALLEAAGERLPPTILRASIGPITSRTLLDYGFPPHVQAPEASMASLAECLAHYLAGR